MNTLTEEAPAVSVDRGEVCVGCGRQTVTIGHSAKIDVVTTMSTFPGDGLVKLLAFYADLDEKEMRALIAHSDDSVKVGTELTGTEARKVMNEARHNGTRVGLRLHDDLVSYGDPMAADPLVYVVAKKKPTFPYDAVRAIDELIGVAGDGMRAEARARNTRGEMFDALRHVPVGNAAAVADQLKLHGFDCVGLRLG